MKAEDAKNIAIKAQESDLENILQKIKLQAEQGCFGLTLTNHLDINSIKQKLLIGMGYEVKWISIDKNSGYWQINW